MTNLQKKKKRKIGANASRGSSADRRIFVFGGFKVNPLMYPRGSDIQSLTDNQVKFAFGEFSTLEDSRLTR